MNATLRASRRQVLEAVLGSLSLLPAVANAAPLVKRHAACRRSRLLQDIFTHRASAERIGEEYLRNHPQESDPDRLLREFFGDNVLMQLGDHPTSRALSTRLEQMIREDFRTDAVVSVGGWMLSRTEARLCAIAALV